MTEAPTKLEVRKRTDTPSIIWLHDGLWIGREVDDQILYAESHVRRLLFPHSPTLPLPPLCFRSLICIWRGRLPSQPAHPPLTPRCLSNAIKGPNEAGEGGRLLGNFQLPNSVIFFFCLNAAWLNEGRCPGGRPSVSEN